MSFIKSFYEILIDREFKLVDNSFDKDKLDDESQYVAVCKEVGAVFYIVGIINGKFEYKENVRKFENYFEKITSNLEFNNIVLINVIAAENITNDILEFVSINRYALESKFINVCWAVDVLNKNVIVGKGQPDKILNIKELIIETLSKFDIKKDESVFVKNYAFKAYKERVDRLKGGGKVSFIIILLNFFIFCLMELNGGSENTNVLIDFGAIEPNLVIYSKEYYRLFTAMFLHIGYMHIIANSWAIWLFGSRFEAYVSKGTFIFVYLISGISASLLSLFFSGSVSAGASGAIMGILGGMLSYSFVNGKSIGGFSLYFIILFVIVSFSFDFIIPGIDNAAHLGGFIAGAVFTFIKEKLILLKQKSNQ